MNNVTLVGRLGSDPTESNGTVKFSIATNDGTKDKPKTNWHNIVAFGKTGEVLMKYLKKADQVAISGKIDYNKYEDKIYTNIIVNSFSFIGGSKNENNKTDKASITENKSEPIADEEENLPF